MADASVRAARADEAQAIGQVQAAAWRAAYADVLPPDALDPSALAAGWEQTIRTRPDARHVVLVALDGMSVVGAAASAPAADADLDPATDVELHVLLVDPAAARHGHGTRLQQAVVDLTAESGATRLVAWLSTYDEALRALLATSGWAPDGATRELDLRGDGEVLVRQERWRTVLG